MIMGCRGGGDSMFMVILFSLVQGQRLIQGLHQRLTLNFPWTTHPPPTKLFTHIGCPRGLKLCMGFQLTKK